MESKELLRELKYLRSHRVFGYDIEEDYLEYIGGGSVIDYLLGEDRYMELVRIEKGRESKKFREGSYVVNIPREVYDRIDYFVGIEEGGVIIYEYAVIIDSRV